VDIKSGGIEMLDDLMYVRQVEPVLPWVLVLGDICKSGGNVYVLHV
jgi:hypothetical protein